MHSDSLLTLYVAAALAALAFLHLFVLLGFRYRVTLTIWQGYLVIVLWPVALIVAAVLYLRAVWLGLPLVHSHETGFEAQRSCDRCLTVLRSSAAAYCPHCGQKN